MTAKEFVCSLQYGCEWSRVLGFGLGLAAGLSFVPVIHLTYAWTSWLLKRAVGRVTEWGSLTAAVFAGLVANAAVLLPLFPLSLVTDRKTYVATAAWGVLVGVVFQRLRQRWRS